MRRYSGGLVSRRSRGAVAPAAALVAAALVAVAAAPAGATITPVTHDDAGALTAAARRWPRRVSAATRGRARPSTLRATERQSGRPSRTPRAACPAVPARRHDVPRPLDRRCDRGRPARPGWRRSRASTTAGTPIRRAAATAASTITMLQLSLRTRSAPSRRLSRRSTSASCRRSTRRGSARAFNDAFIAEVDNASAWTTSGPSVIGARTTSPRRRSASR